MSPPNLTKCRFRVQLTLSSTWNVLSAPAERAQRDVAEGSESGDRHVRRTFGVGVIRNDVGQAQSAEPGSILGNPLEIRQPVEGSPEVVKQGGRETVCILQDQVLVPLGGPEAKSRNRRAWTERSGAPNRENSVRSSMKYDVESRFAWLK